MELLYARGRASSTKQPGLLKHRDKRLLLAIIVSAIAGAGLGEIFWPRADATPIVRLAVYSDSLQIDALTQVVEDQVIPELTSVDGVADVSMYGDQERTLRVLLDPMKLASYGLSVADVANVMRNARYDVPAGSFQSREQEVLVRANASVIEPSKIEDLFIREPVRIGDVATVFFGPATAESWVRLNGRSVLSLGIVRQASSNTIAIAEGVAKVVERLKTQIPNITVETISDDSLFIKGSIAELLTTLGYTIMIVVLVLVVAAVALPVLALTPVLAWAQARWCSQLLNPQHQYCAASGLATATLARIPQQLQR